MTKLSDHRFRQLGVALLAVAALLGLFNASELTAEANTGGLMDRVSKQVQGFLEQFADVKCTERVRQEKLGEKGKVQLAEESTYDYLVILTSTGGELSLDESRMAIREEKIKKKNTSLLVTNGFATLFLIFHPYYANSFQFTALEDDVVDGRRLSKVGFQHIKGTRSPVALALRGREYPLEICGTAWIDPQTAVITKIEAGIGNTMEDVGLKSLHTEIEYAPVSFNKKDGGWFPARASVEVETPRQHWRNTHQFADYKKFSVSTEEQVANK